MQFHSCPDCETGWRYADELAARHRTGAQGGLVRCPTCGGTGRIDGRQYLSARFGRAEGRTYW
ncbi:MAG: hypothetical protein H7841_04780 [Magnetospirillum sp. WYHS-4]